MSTVQSAGATWWAARERCCSRGKWCRSSSDPFNSINAGAAPIKLDLLCFVFRPIFIFFSTELKVAGPGSTLWQSTDSLQLREVILLLISLAHQNQVDIPYAPPSSRVQQQPWFCWTMLAPVQSLGSLCYALQSTGYLLELCVEWNHLELGAVPTAITLTEYRAQFKGVFNITCPVTPGPCAHCTWLAPVHRAYEIWFWALL